MQAKVHLVFTTATRVPAVLAAASGKAPLQRCLTEVNDQEDTAANND